MNVCMMRTRMDFNFFESKDRKISSAQLKINMTSFHMKMKTRLLIHREKERFGPVFR